jgi:hypothetical protein
MSCSTIKDGISSNVSYYLGDSLFTPRVEYVCGSTILSFLHHDVSYCLPTTMDDGICSELGIGTRLFHVGGAWSLELSINHNI